MRSMAAWPAYPIPVKATVDDLVHKTRADVARHGGVVWIGRRGRQARQLRRVQAASRADAYQAHYFAGESGAHVLTVGPIGPSPRAIAWWGTAG